MVKRTELEVFEKFSRHYPVKLDMSTVREVSPPKPDIEINECKGRKIAFEISEIIDEGFISRVNSKLTVKSACDDYYKKLDEKFKKEFNKKYSNYLIYIIFHESSSLKNKINSIPLLFNYLINLQSIENRHMPNNLTICKVVKKIRFTKGKYSEPYFDVCDVGGIGDPIVARLKDKLKKHYETDAHSIELILYYDFQPELLKRWIDEGCNYAQKEINNSIFYRIWIYSFSKDKVIKVYNKTFDKEDLQAFHQRKTEPTISYERLLMKMKKSGKL